MRSELRKRGWSGNWREGTLIEGNEPFGWPFRAGQTVLIRDCDLGVACLSQEPAAIRYLMEEEVPSEIKDLKPAKQPAKVLNALFELVREELLASAGDAPPSTLSGEVTVPRGLPLVHAGHIVHCADGISDFPDPGWLAEWYYSPDGRSHIVFERQAAYAALAMRDEAWLTKTLQHETFESQAAKRMAQQEYGRIAPDAMNALTNQFDALAHFKTVLVVEGFPALAPYNQALMAWIKKARLPNPPARNQIV